MSCKEKMLYITLEEYEGLKEEIKIKEDFIKELESDSYCATITFCHRFSTPYVIVKTKDEAVKELADSMGIIKEELMESESKSRKLERYIESLPNWIKRIYKQKQQ